MPRRVTAPRFSWPPAAARLLAAGLAAALAVAACGSVAPSAAPSMPASPSAAASSSSGPAASPSAVASSEAPSPSASAEAAAQRLLEVHTEGGFINPAASIGALPTVVVDADGRIYTPAGAPDGPLPLIPAVTVHDTGAAGAAAILEAATAAGLVDGTGGGGVVADTGSTVFTMSVDGDEIVSRVAGGGPMGPGGPGVHPGASGGTESGSPRPGAAALDLLSRLTDTTTPWGGATANAVPFVPTAYRLWVAPIAAGGTGGAAAAWPLTADPNAFGAPAAADLGVDGLRSGVVTGPDAAQLAKALASVEAGSTLSFGGHAYQVWVRPLLPDEMGG
ncbi:MAG: hypothetical protein U0838_09575 [Chloroflexota bacterium]